MRLIAPLSVMSSRAVTPAGNRCVGSAHFKLAAIGNYQRIDLQLGVVCRVERKRAINADGRQPRWNHAVDIHFDADRNQHTRARAGTTPPCQIVGSDQFPLRTA